MANVVAVVVVGYYMYFGGDYCHLIVGVLCVCFLLYLDDRSYVNFVVVVFLSHSPYFAKFVSFCDELFEVPYR